MNASSTTESRRHSSDPSRDNDGQQAKLLRRLIAYLIMAIVAMLLAVAMTTLVTSFVPSWELGQAHGQEKAEVGPVSGDESVPGRVSEVDPTLTWKFVTALEELGYEPSGAKMKLILEAAHIPAETFEVEHAGALGFFPYGKLRKAAHLIDFFRNTELALDQIELNFYDFDKLTKSGYDTLLEQMQSAETDAFALKKKDGENPNPFMVLVADWPTVMNWQGVQRAYDNTPFVGTAVVWNQDVAKLLDYYSAEWVSDQAVPAFTEEQRMEYAKNAMYAVLASANGVAEEQLAQFAGVDGTPDGKVYIGLPSQLKELGPDHVEAFSYKSHLQSGLYGLNK